MTDQQKTEVDKYKTIYEVYHAEGNHFHGNSTLYVAVIEETDDRIIGDERSHMMDRPGSPLVVIKDNVAGWKEREFMPGRKKEQLEPSADDIRDAYANGKINEETMEKQLEEAVE